MHIVTDSPHSFPGSINNIATMKLTMRIPILFIAVLACLPSQIRAQTKPKVPTGNSSTANQLQIETIIDRLASKNPKPPKEQRTLSPYEDEVWVAAEELRQLGTTAFSSLISHLDDDRFSFSEDCSGCSSSDNPVYHQTVGSLCRRILQNQIKVYVQLIFI